MECACRAEYDRNQDECRPTPTCHEGPALQCASQRAPCRLRAMETAGEEKLGPIRAFVATVGARISGRRGDAALRPPSALLGSAGIAPALSHRADRRVVSGYSGSEHVEEQLADHRQNHRRHDDLHEAIALAKRQARPEPSTEHVRRSHRQRYLPPDGSPPSE